ncbi:MAG: hypothetical protein WDZ51_19680 [Pirellulaceae bacterium]
MILLAFMVGLPVAALMPDGVQVSLASLLSRDRMMGEDHSPNVSPDETETVSSHSTPLAETSWVAAPLYQPPADLDVAPSLFKPVGTDSALQVQSLLSRRSLELEEELYNLGATYSRMESWGAAPRKFRFHCTVAIKIGLAEYSQRFEETADNPLAALEQVLAEVRTWHDRFDAERFETATTDSPTLR